MNDRFRYSRWLLLPVTLWCLGILAAPLLQPSSVAGRSFSAGLYAFYGTVCHQADERSFHLGDRKLAVCERCCAVYAAFWLGWILAPLLLRMTSVVRHHRYLLAAAAVLLVLDVVLNLAGVHESSTASRAVTGAFIGFVLPFTVLPPLTEALGQIRSRRRSSPVLPCPGDSGHA